MERTIKKSRLLGDLLLCSIYFNKYICKKLSRLTTKEKVKTKIILIQLSVYILHIKYIIIFQKLVKLYEFEVADIPEGMSATNQCRQPKSLKPTADIRKLIQIKSQLALHVSAQRSHKPISHGLSHHHAFVVFAGKDIMTMVTGSRANTGTAVFS
ncbi:MAG: hypothetical protein WCV71_04370 [Patescibacteria group bacterium]